MLANGPQQKQRHTKKNQWILRKNADKRHGELGEDNGDGGRASGNGHRELGIGKRGSKTKTKKS
ncbi:GD16102 [Drosophila simulans]|uniref:GD16102 n=1 Tax=Drosophila simulans TaxID=7240 RepID=B4R6K5_DROSI|nr:GD16102 [Drosophila simulans]